MINGLTKRFLWASRREWLTLAAFGVSLVLNLVTNRMAPWFTQDTSGYLAVANWPGCLAQARFPLYGTIVNGIAHLSGGFSLMPWLQVFLLLIATLIFLRAARVVGMPEAACAAVGVAVGLSNITLIWSRALMPTVPAAACLLLAMAALLRISVGGERWHAREFVQAGLFSMLAWMFDPGLLAFVFVLPLLFISLAGCRKWRRAGMIFLCCAVPFGSVATLRAVTVGDFNVVSFGGFQMSGMAGLMLSPDMLAHLPPQEQLLANAILAGRTNQEVAGKTIATPENSFGQKSFPSEAFNYFDILARTHDSVLYGVVANQRAAGESWVAFNARLQKFDIAVIRVAPVDYASWVFGAFGRLIGHMLVMNGIFILSFAAWLVMILFGLLPRTPSIADQRLVVLLAWFTIGASALTVLVTFPAERYIDMAGLLLPSLPLYGLFNRVRWMTMAET